MTTPSDDRPTDAYDAQHGAGEPYGAIPAATPAYQAPPTSGYPMAAGGPDLLGALPADDDLAQKLQAHQSSKGLTKPVLAFVAVAILGVGIVGGVGMSQAFGSDGDSSTPTAGADGFPGGLARGEGFAGGQGGPGGTFTGGFGGATSGTITAIDGDTITVTEADGTVVKVNTTDNTTVSITTDGTLDQLAAGDTVVVLGETADNGDVTATSISEGGVLQGLGRPGGGAGGPVPTPTN